MLRIWAKTNVTVVMWSFGLIVWVSSASPCRLAQAGIVTISTSTPTGTANRDSPTNFVGILDNNAPPQIGGQNVNFNNVPAGELFFVGDLVGRDMNDSGGGRIWEYNLTLPVDAVAGTGLTNIGFNGHAFENSANNLEGADAVIWELFLNSDVVPVASSGPVAGSDWTTFDPVLFDAGGATINQVRVVFTVTSFNGGPEWFATRGTLMADYLAIPEPQSTLAFLAIAAMVVRRFGRYRPHF